MPAATDLQPLALGSQAPDFSLMATGGNTISLADYKGQNLVIVFYPKDKTPGCTKQLCALRDDLAQFNDLNTAVLGSNPGSLKSHESFVEAQGYNFPILVDEEKTMAAAYQALKPEGGIQRTVYVLDGEGVVRFAQQGMPSDADLLEAIRSF